MCMLRFILIALFCRCPLFADAVWTTTFQCVTGVHPNYYWTWMECGWYAKQLTGNGCTRCEENYYCPGDSYRYAMASRCPIGSYKTSSGDACLQIECTSCPSGYACPDGIYNYSLDECNGLPGMYLASRGDANTRSVCQSCTLCGPGEVEFSACGLQNRICGRCQEGFYRDNSTCIPCGPGFYCANSTRIACESGFYCANNTKLACLPGSTSPPNSTSYVDCRCKEGYSGVVYSPYHATCTLCPIGHFCPALVNKICNC
jgi:hypothetical protein